MNTDGTLETGSECRRQCDAMGVSRVRALLREDDASASAGWRREAQQWLDERLRRDGERTYAMVLVSITLLLAAIVVLACVSWG